MAVETDEIASVIGGLHPNLYAKDVQLYAKIIQDYSEEYDIDWKIPVAIFSQESSFNYQAVNWESNDYGIGQMNRFNIVRRKLKLGLLLTDVDYAIHESFKLLYETKTKYNTGARGHWQWFTRYHSYTPSRRKIYYKYLDAKFKKIKRILNEYEKSEETFQDYDRRKSSYLEEFKRRKADHKSGRGIR
jgi:hypothetical protein